MHRNKLMDPDIMILLCLLGGSTAWCVPHLFWAAVCRQHPLYPQGWVGYCTVLHCRWASEPQVCELCPKFNLLICEMRESNMMISFFDIALFFFLQKHYIFATKNTHHKTLNYKKHKEKNKESPRDHGHQQLGKYPSWHFSMWAAYSLCPPQRPLPTFEVQLLPLPPTVPV